MKNQNEDSRNWGRTCDTVHDHHGRIFTGYIAYPVMLGGSDSERVKIDIETLKVGADGRVVRK